MPAPHIIRIRVTGEKGLKGKLEVRRIAESRRPFGAGGGKKKKKKKKKKRQAWEGHEIPGPLGKVQRRRLEKESKDLRPREDKSAEDEKKSSNTFGG